MDIKLNDYLKNKRTEKIFSVTNIQDYLDVSGVDDVWKKLYRISMVGGKWTTYWLEDNKIENRFELVELSFDEWKALVDGRGVKNG